MTGAKFKAFLSHSSKDKDRVREVKTILQASGVTCWLDEEQVTFGDNLAVEIQKGLEASECALIFWSENAKESDWLTEEWTAIFMHKRLIPVRLDDCELPPFFRSRLWVNLRTGDRSSVDRLAAQLSR